MSTSHHSPSWAARHVLSVVEEVHAEAGEFSIEPSPLLVLGVQRSGQLSNPPDERPTRFTHSGATGLLEGPRRFARSAGVEHTLLILRPESAYTVFGIGAHALSEESLASDDLLGAARANELYERVCEAPDAAARKEAILQVLDALPRRNTLSPFVGAAKALIDMRQGDLLIGTLDRDLGVSARQLERRFLEEVGLSPKRYARLVRFHHARQLAATADRLADAAYEAGYSDPAHFARDMKRYLGRTASSLRG